MENVEYTTPEQKAICDMIKARRRYSRLVKKTKTITTLVSTENNHNISAKTLICYNKNTGHISLGFGLGWMTYIFYPKKIGKMRCIDSHTISIYNNNKASLKKLQNRNIYRFVFSEYFENINIRLDECIDIYDGYIPRVHSHFIAQNKIKIKYINQIDVHDRSNR